MDYGSNQEMASRMSNPTTMSFYHLNGVETKATESQRQGDSTHRAVVHFQQQQDTEDHWLHVKQNYMQ